MSPTSADDGSGGDSRLSGFADHCCAENTRTNTVRWRIAPGHAGLANVRVSEIRSTSGGHDRVKHLRVASFASLVVVAEDLRQLDRWVRRDRWPYVACPVCLVGHLALDSIEAVPSARSTRIYEKTHYPLDLSGAFHGLIRCAISTCRETVAIAGDYCVDIDVDDGGDTTYVDLFRLRFATPPLKIILPPPRTPRSVVKAIESAAAVIWADANAGANRLRVAIDELLTAYGMPRFRNSNGKRWRIPTDVRIKEFRRFEDQVADTLEAVKWIGNQGSHESGLSATDVLDGADLLGSALKQLYDTSEEEIQRRVRAVNKRRGLPPNKRKQRSALLATQKQCASVG